MQVSVYRYNPDLDEVPVMRDVSVDLPEGKDLMVLDVLQLIKDEDPTLSFRRSCREGVCGSDGINMNGKNGLACITPVSEVVKRNKLVLRPLPPAKCLELGRSRSRLEGSGGEVGTAPSADASSTWGRLRGGGVDGCPCGCDSGDGCCCGGVCFCCRWWCWACCCCCCCCCSAAAAALFSSACT